MLPQRGDKRPFTAGQAHFHPRAVVADVASERQPLRQLPDEGAKTHPLHPALNA